MGIIYGKGIYMPIYKKTIKLGLVPSGTKVRIFQTNDNQYHDYYMAVSEYEPTLGENAKRALMVSADIESEVEFSDIYGTSGPKPQIESYINRFSNNLQKAIYKTTHYHSDALDNTSEITESCFVPSVVEMGAIPGNSGVPNDGTTRFPSNTINALKTDSGFVGWWTRSFKTYTNPTKPAAWYVSASGTLETNRTTKALHGVRFCFTLPNTSEVEPNSDGTIFTLIEK